MTVSATVILATGADRRAARSIHDYPTTDRGVVRNCKVSRLHGFKGKTKRL